MKADVEISLNTSMREYFDDAVQNFIKSDPSSTPQEIEDYKVVMEGVGGILETEFAEDLNKIPAAVILAGGDLLDLDNVIIPGGTKSIINFLLEKLPSDNIEQTAVNTSTKFNKEVLEDDSRINDGQRRRRRRRRTRGACEEQRRIRSKSCLNVFSRLEVVVFNFLHILKYFFSYVKKRVE